MFYDQRLMLLCCCLIFCFVDAAKKAFDAKVKENDDFVQKMKKEINQAERQAKENLLLEKQVHELQEAKKKDEATLAKLQSDLEKVPELHAKEKATYESELEKSKQELIDAEGYCAARFDVFSEKLAGEHGTPHTTITFLSNCFHSNKLSI